MTTRHLFRSAWTLAAVVALALTAAGCTVARTTSARTGSAGQHRGLAAQPAAETVADVPWWQVYQDPVLQGLIREGIASNLDLRSASARVMESRALAGIAKSYLYPTSASASALQEQRSRVGDPKLTENRSLTGRTATGRSPARCRGRSNLFGRLRRGKEAAFAQYLASEEGRRAVLITLVGDIA